MALHFQLARKLIRAILSYLHLFYIPPADSLHCFLWEEAFCLDSYIRLLKYNSGSTYIVLCCVSCSNIMQNNNVKFWASSAGLIESGVCFGELKKDHCSSLKSGNAPEEERYISNVVYYSYCGRCHLKNHYNRQNSINWQLWITIHDDHRSLWPKRMGVGINTKATERIKWVALESSSRKVSCAWGWAAIEAGAHGIQLKPHGCKEIA